MGSGRSHAKIGALYEIETDTSLGDGSEGTMCRATKKSSGVEVAVKTLPSATKSVRLKWKREIEIMELLDHPNIIKLYDSFTDRTNTYIVMELCTGGDLHHRISECGKFLEWDAANVVKQVVPAIQYMHEKQICHRDLKPENILFAKEDSIDTNTVKIIDFGLSKRFKDGQVLTTVLGSPHYVAPQVLAGKYNHLSDMWSFGVIIYVMLCGSPPFKANSDEEVMMKVRVGKIAFDFKEWKFVSEEAQLLVSMLLKMDPAERFTPEQVMSDDWVVDPPKEAVTRTSLRLSRRGSNASAKSAKSDKRPSVKSATSEQGANADVIDSPAKDNCELESGLELNRMFGVLESDLEAPFLPPPRQPLPHPTPLTNAKRTR